MKTLNFQEKLPEFGILNYNKSFVTTEEPYKIFFQQRKSKGTTSVTVKCSCPDSFCKNNLLFFTMDSIDIFLQEILVAIQK